MQEITASRPLKDLLIQGYKMSRLFDTRTVSLALLGKTGPAPGQHMLLKMGWWDYRKWYVEWGCCREKGEGEFRTLGSSEFSLAGGLQSKIRWLLAI